MQAQRRLGFDPLPNPPPARGSPLNACRRPLFTEKRMAARQVVNAAACGKCPFPRAGAAAGRAWVLWTQHACRRVEPLARRGLQDRLGWGSNAGTAPAMSRPPPQPSPCPGAGARTSVARTLGVRRSFTMRNVLILESGPLHPDAWVRCGGQVAPLFPKGVSLVPMSPSVRHVASRAVTRHNPARQRRPDTKPALTVDRPRRHDETSPMRCTRRGACELRQ